MRTILLVLILTLPACGYVEGEREAAAEAAREATLAEVGRILSRTAGAANRHARSAERILRPLPVMTPGEEQALRRFLAPAHVARARALGVRVSDRANRDSLVAAGRLVRLADSTAHWIVRPGTAPAYVLPQLRDVLELLGARFQDRIGELGLPAYRFEITSSLRTAEGQARLRRSNSNAAAGVSSHEFGATVDVSYAAFAPPLERPAALLEDVPVELRPHLERFVDLSMESVSARKSRELGAIFSQILRQAQAEGVVLVIYERQQTVYHLSVGSVSPVALQPSE